MSNDLLKWASIDSRMTISQTEIAHIRVGDGNSQAIVEPARAVEVSQWN